MGFSISFGSGSVHLMFDTDLVPPLQPPTLCAASLDGNFPIHFFMEYFRSKFRIYSFFLLFDLQAFDVTCWGIQWGYDTVWFSFVFKGSLQGR